MGRGGGETCPTRGVALGLLCPSTWVAGKGEMGRGETEVWGTVCVVAVCVWQGGVRQGEECLRQVEECV